jgi:hypothetical protein
VSFGHLSTATCRVRKFVKDGFHLNIHPILSQTMVLLTGGSCVGSARALGVEPAARRWVGPPHASLVPNGMALRKSKPPVRSTPHTLADPS